MSDVRAEIIALVEHARSEGSKVVAIEALDQVLHGFPDDAERIAVAIFGAVRAAREVEQP